MMKVQVIKWHTGTHSELRQATQKCSNGIQCQPHSARIRLVHSVVSWLCFFLFITGALTGTAQAATVTLHPSGQSAAPASSASWTTTGGTGWVDVLDSNDADTTYASACCTGPTVKFYVDMDDPAGLSGATINSITTYAVVKCSAAGVLTVPVGYLTDGATAVWSGAAACGTAYAAVSGGPYTTNSVGGALSLTDINNLQLAVDRIGTGPTSMRVTEVYAVVDYSFPTEYYVGNTTDVVDGTTDCNNPVNTTCSLREAINAVNAAGAGVHNVHLPTGTITITGASGDNNNASGDYDLKSANNQTVNFTGTGSANTIISGGALDRIFDITSSTVTTTFTDLKLMNGTAPAGSSGGCVQSAGGNLTFTRTIVTGCSASGVGKGGGAYINTATANTLTIDSSTFSTNTASGSNAGAAYAASISISGTSTFSGNSAGAHGGALFASSGTGSVTITSTTGTSSFTTNSTTGYGGAIYATNTVDITGATFDQNHADTASQRGGAVHVQGTLGTFTNCTITNNTAAGQGGGLNSLSAITINNSTISGNTASTGNGGGVYVGTNLIITATTTVTGNTAGAAGGGLYAGGTATIDGATIGTTLSPNHSTTGTATVRGGGIGSGGNMSISNSSVIGNYTFGGGGGIASGGTTTITSSTISGNQSTGSTGGGIYSQSTATITDSTVSGNSASGNGGGILANGDPTVTRSTFSGNSSSSSGGGIYRATGNVYLYNSTLSGNTSTATGAGIWTQNCTITNSTIYGNSATNASTVGGVYKTGTCTYTNTITANNTGNGAAANCNAATSGGYNIESANTCAFAGAGDLPNTNPLVNALASNGGPTQTHALQAASPAIDKASNATCAAAPINNVDQRGQARPIDGDAVPGAVCDIGAYEYVPATATTTLATGTDPGNASLAPGGAATMADAFTLQTSSGTDTITAVVVTLAAGTSGGLSLVEITDSAGATVYGSTANPASDTPSITLSTNTLTATTTLTTYKIRVTPKSHANMPAPAGSSYAVTAYISNWTGTNTHAGSDTGGTTVTIDNLSPGNVTVATATAGNTQVSLAWTNPADSDLGSIVVLRSTAAVADTPVEGSTYTVGNTIGSSTVACVVTGSPPATSCTDTGLTNGTAYHYKIFAKDTNGNYSATGVVPTGSPATPNVTTLANGTDPGNTSLAPGGAATMADAFTFQTGSGTDTITAVTVTLAAGTSGGLSLVEITNDAGTTVYGSTSNPGSDTPSITLSTNTLTATTSATQYKIRITPKTHANMPAPAGSTYSVTAYISNWAGTNTHAGSDTGGTTVTIDNQSPGNVTAATATAGNTQVSLGWTNPGDGDLNSIVVLRKTGGAVADTPVEGSTYIVGNTIGASTVACVVTGSPPTNSCTDTGLTNGTAYYYLIFAKDSNGNYSATGVVPTGSPATPAAGASPSLTFLKTVSVTSDPYNNGTNPKYIPGAEALYTMRVTNSGAGTVDNNTLIVTDPIPANTELFTGNLSGGAPFIFTDGTPTSGLSCAFVALNNLADCMDFSNDSGATWTYVPNGTFDSAVTNIRFSLSGSMNGTGGGNPYFELKFRVRVK